MCQSSATCRSFTMKLHRRVAGLLRMVVFLMLPGWAYSEGDKCIRSMETNGYITDEYPANKPIEDRHVVVESNGELHAVVADGHGGTLVSQFVKDNLIPHVLAEINKLQPTRSEGEVADAFTAAFEAVEKKWIKRVKEKGPEEQRKMVSVGACALYALVTQSKVFAANAGDCRAVVGRRSVGGKIYPVSISFDHNSREKREQEALAKAHPGEDDIVVCPHPEACYVKGRIQPTRAFGDLAMKLPEYSPSPGWTVPYLSAVPEVTVTRLDRRDLFLILASDGLWDVFSPLQAVRIVSKVLEEKGSIQSARNTLIEAALEKVAQSHGRPVSVIKNVPQGARRQVHDDITVVVVAFKEVTKGPCEAEAPAAPEEEEEEYWDVYGEEEGEAGHGDEDDEDLLLHEAHYASQLLDADAQGSKRDEL